MGYRNKLLGTIMDWPSFVLSLVLGFIFLLLFFYFLLYSRPSLFPPGPPSLPLLGAYPFLSGNGAEKYFGPEVCSFGPVTGLYAGSYPTIVLNDWPLAKSLFAKEEFCGRLNNFTTNWARCMGGESLGIVMTDGKRWTSQRSFAVKHLRNFGFGKKDLEVVIEREASSLVEHILANNGNEMRMEMFTFAVPVLNVLWDMVAGHAFKREDKELRKILDLMNFVFSSKVFAIAMMAPWVRFIFPSFTGYNKRLEALRSMQDVVHQEMKEHLKDIDYDSPRDLIDSYLIEMKTSGDPEFRGDQLTMMGMDLMGAGADTTSTTLLWTVIYLVLNPEVQESCYQEINEHLGAATVSLTDMSKLQFCQATIAEIQRVSVVAISGIQHRVTKTTTLPTGHVVPEGSIAMTNIKKFLSDPELWDQPEQFNPERFLDQEGKFVKPELFIFFVALVQRIRFSVVVGKEPNPENYSIGITRVPDSYTVQIDART